MGTINTTLSCSKSGANADEILVSLLSDFWTQGGAGVLKEATGLQQEGESTAWGEGGKDSERIVTIFCVILSNVGIAKNSYQHVGHLRKNPLSGF